MSPAEQARTEQAAPQRTVSVVHKSRWPGWIWAIPLAAAGVVAWLLVREYSRSGTDVTVVFDESAEMQPQTTKVEYRGVKVGTVNSVDLSKDRQHVIVHLDIDDVVKPALLSGTRFYLSGGTPSFSDLQSLKSIVAGPTIILDPGSGAPTRHYEGILGEPRPRLQVAVPYSVEFEGEAVTLKAGSPVTLLGFNVGEVRSAQLSTDADSGTVSTTAIIDLDPTRFHLQGTQVASGQGRQPASGPGAQPVSDPWRVRLDAALNQMIRHGLRARLDKTPPLVGSQQIVLDVKQPPGASLQTAELLTKGAYPQIPASGGGGLEEIEDNVRAVTAQVKTLVASPQLAATIAHLERATAGIEKVVKSAGPQVAPTLESTRHTVDELQSAAGEIEAAAAAVRKTVGGGAVAPNGNMQEAVHELTGAARSVRTLANYLDQHPEALIKGRTE